MKMSGREESSNVVDRRRKTAVVAGGAGGVGIAGLLIYFLLSGGNVNQTLQYAQQHQGTAQQQTVKVDGTQKNSEFYKTNGDFANEDELFKFTSQILKSTEKIWGDVFKADGKTYAEPKMVVFSETTNSACGTAKSSMGPFYCPGDQTLYLDLDFLATMKRTLGSTGDFAFAYVIAHEVGHHVEYLTGDLAKYNRQEQMLKQQGQKAAASLISVQIELQADCYAGVWGKRENQTFSSLENTDFMEAFQAAKTVGDDSLGMTNQENFSHGSAKMRQAWFRRGFDSGDYKNCNTYQYESLSALENI